MTQIRGSLLILNNVTDIAYTSIVFSCKPLVNILGSPAITLQKNSNQLDKMFYLLYWNTQNKSKLNKNKSRSNIV